MKKPTVICILIGLFWCVPWLCWGQLQVSFPSSRMVLQRSNANTASMHITGYYTVQLSRIEARLLARDGQGTNTDWATIQSNPQGGVYGGDLLARGGWYNLEVRGIVNEQPVGLAVVERVGVGEVFLVAGQSNAQGIYIYETGLQVSAPGAGNDRVNCVNFYTESQSDPPLPVFSHIDGGSNLAPGGRTGWCWGVLGDLLSQRLNVPVLFMNAGWAATTLENWQESYTTGTTFNGYTGQPLPPGQPYANLRTALRAYTNMLGIRAVLWHQGEADNRLNTFFPSTYSSAAYASRLLALINQSRQDSGKPIAWVVARASYDDQFKSNPNILAGQNTVIANTPNVYAGPNTDGIQIPRNRGASDGVHFDAAGMVDVANAWNNSLSDNFFNAVQPQLPAPMPSVSIACAGNNQVRMSVSGYASADWRTGQNGLSIVGGTGQYQAKVKDNLGNISYSPVFNVNPAPSIGGSSVICEGSTLTLTANYDNVIWSTNTQGRSITVGTGGTYSAKYNDVSGCTFTSNSIDVTVSKLPPAPAITALKPTVFCQGDNTILSSTGAVRYNWNNGSQGQQVNIGTSGTYFLTITDANGCTSPVSNGIVVTANPVPAKPTIAASGPLTFCADQSVTLTAPESAAYFWSTGQTTRSITTSQAGQYAVRVLNGFSCSSEISASIALVVNSLPGAPSLLAEGPTTFCDGGRVTLRVNTTLNPIWTTGETTPTVIAKQSGNYSARVQDANGCLSPLAPAILVDAKPVPIVPVIQQAGTYILQAGTTNSTTMYSWLLERDTLLVKTPLLKISQTGNYAARAYIRYPNGLTCASLVSTPFFYTLPVDNGGLSVYPNPSPDKILLVETLDILTSASITIYTVSGQEVLKRYTDQLSGPAVLNLADLSKGTYLLRVEAGNFKGTKRILVGEH